MNAKAFLVSGLFLIACTQTEVTTPSASGPVPSPAQLAWHQMEMNAFIHFTINTFTDMEWGMGSESTALFNPSQFNAEQWVEVLKETGFKGVILTCKHHDGFCLWPSEHTKHSVKSSPFESGKGDIVRALSDACKKYGLKFGVYLSPWDRNHPEYGTPAYVTYYRNQLKELFTNYGPIFEMWFDGANGGTGYYGGKNEKRTINGATYYDWPATLDLVRSMEPEIIFFSDAGPGVRWCGNERGIAGETNWNTITPDTLFAGKAGIESLLNSGSETGTHWIPGEVDTSIRPGWFYHASEDSLVKSPERLFEIYLTSVGRGSTLLLNIPPDQRGLFHENDVAALKGWRALLDEAFKTNLAANSNVRASSYRGNSKNYSPENVKDGNPETYWATDDEVNTGSIELKLGGEQILRYLVVQEFIVLGQRVESFTIEVWQDGDWKQVESGTTIGYKRIVKLNSVQTSRVRLNITSAKACPLISNIEIY